MTEHVLDLAVLAFAHGEDEPYVRTLLSLEPRIDRPVMSAVNGDAAAQRVELLLPHAAVRAHAIAAQPAGRRQFERTREPAVVGEQKEALGVEVEAADAQ